MFRSKAEISDFVAGLRIPETRRAELEDELFDHFECHIEAELLRGASVENAEASALEALGDPAKLREGLEDIEPAFSLTGAVGLKTGLRTTFIVVFTAAGIGWLLPGPTDDFEIVLRFVLVTLVGAFLLPRLLPPGMRAVFRDLERAPKGKLRGPRRAAAFYLGCLLFGPPVLSIGLEALLRRSFYHIMVPYFLLWIGFGLLTKASRHRREPPQIVK